MRLANGTVHRSPDRLPAFLLPVSHPAISCGLNIPYVSESSHLPPGSRAPLPECLPDPAGWQCLRPPGNNGLTYALVPSAVV